MEIRVGKYIIKSDQWSCWIEEEYTGKDSKTGKDKKMTRRVAGWDTNFDNLLHSFTQHKHMASEAKTVEEFLKVVKQTAEDTEAINKAALAEDFKIMRRIGKQAKEINRK